MSLTPSNAGATKHLFPGLGFRVWGLGTSMTPSNAGATKHLFPDSKVSVNACHPGVVTSPVLNNLGMASGWDSPDKAATTPLFLALDPAMEVLIS